MTGRVRLLRFPLNTHVLGASRIFFGDLQKSNAQAFKQTD
jgi:hypothetical protein